MKKCAAKKFSAKKTLTLFGCVFLVLTAVVFAAAAYFVSFALDAENDTGSEAESMPSEKTALWETLLPFADDVGIYSRDGLKLAGFLFTPPPGDRAAARENDYVIAVHGYKSHPVSMAFIAAHYLEEGYTVLVPAQRAHASSGGRYIGMGYHEKDDMAAWIAFILSLNPDARIALHGVSMGAATVMLATGEDLPPNVAAVVEDCGYSSVKDEFTAQLSEMFSLPYFPIIPAASLVSKLRAGYFFGEADCVKAVSRSVTPTLFIHGDKDTFVPFSMLEELYQAASCEKEKLVVPGAEHAKAVEVDPALYWETVDRFLSKYVEIF